jgi:hypothetical protein
MTVTWKGRAAEYRDLVNAVGRNCSCEYGLGVRTYCSAHRMIAEDQRALDGLLFARRMSDRLRREEWSNTHEAPAIPSGMSSGVARIR